MGDALIPADEPAAAKNARQGSMAANFGRPPRKPRDTGRSRKFRGQKPGQNSHAKRRAKARDVKAARDLRHTRTANRLGLTLEKYREELNKMVATKRPTRRTARRARHRENVAMLKAAQNAG